MVQVAVPFIETHQVPRAAQPSHCLGPERIQTSVQVARASFKVIILPGAAMLP